MGRPLNKRYFGNVVDGSADGNLTVSVKVGSNAASTVGIILSQRSETKFKVDDSNDGTGTEGICTLVNKAVGSLGDNEMSLAGWADGNEVFIRKVQNRTMIDFDNNRYTWEIQDDSTQNILALTAI
jgi:hypothetical protein